MGFFKSVTKVFKKAAPVAALASAFIPGVGPAVSSALGAIGLSGSRGLFGTGITGGDLFSAGLSYLGGQQQQNFSASSAVS